jgi:hypothetical protein
MNIGFEMGSKILNEFCMWLNTGMYPEQQAPAPRNDPGSAHNPYEFIVNPDAPKKSRGFSNISGNSFVMKLLVVVGGAVIVMLVIGFVINIFFGAKINTGDIIGLAQTETELIRLGGLGVSTASEQTRAAAINTKLTLTTHRTQWTNFLLKHGTKLKDAQLALKKSKTTDTQLAQAKQTTTFDPAYIAIMRTQLQAYITALKDGYANAAGATEKAIFNTQYDQAKTLLAEWPDTAQTP